MSAPNRTSLADTAARAAPWSTRAVILIAFAIQLMPVSERAALASWKPADRLMLIDGRLAALWMADAAAQAVAEAPVPEWAVELVPEGGREFAAGSVPARPGLRERAGGALLPIPPPALA